METSQNQKRMQLCPRFASCSVPECPLDDLVSLRIKLAEESVCPYTTNRKGRRIRPIPEEVRKFLKPQYDGGFKSIFEKTSPEGKDKLC